MFVHRDDGSVIYIDLDRVEQRHWRRPGGVYACASEEDARQRRALLQSGDEE